MQSVQWLVFIKDCIQFKQTEQHAHSCPHSGLACSTFVSSRRKTKKNRISFVCVCVEGSEEKEPFRVPSQARPPTLHLVVHRLYFFLLSFFFYSQFLFFLLWFESKETTGYTGPITQHRPRRITSILFIRARPGNIVRKYRPSPMAIRWCGFQLWTFTHTIATSWRFQNELFLIKKEKQKKRNHETKPDGSRHDSNLGKDFCFSRGRKTSSALGQCWFYFVCVCVRGERGK